MADDWISAHDTLELLASGMERIKAARQIKDWAEKGLVPARAKLLWKKRIWLEPEVSTDAPIPSYFWNRRTSKGRMESGVRRVEEDWGLGNFEAWVHHEVLYQAFGVEFEGSNLLELLPEHLRPKSAKRGRPEEYDWDRASATVCAQFDKAKFVPQKKVEVVRALNAALGDLDQYPVSSVVKLHAEPIWQRYRKAD